MYSYFNWEDIKVVDYEGLKKYIEDVKAGKHAHRKPTAPDEVCAETIVLNDENESCSFEGFDVWKIISYYYENFVCFLRDVAVFLEGEVHWTFENSDEGGYIQFHNGKLIINAGHMKWSTYTPEEMCGNSQHRKGIDKLPEELQKRLVMRNL